MTSRQIESSLRAKNAALTALLGVEGAATTRHELRQDIEGLHAEHEEALDNERRAALLR